MRFRISRHSGVTAPEDSLDRLWQKLDADHEDVSFAKVDPFIMATQRDDAPVSMTHDERVDIGRRLVLGVLGDVCERGPELQFDWFAVSSDR